MANATRRSVLLGSGALVATIAGSPGSGASEALASLPGLPGEPSPEFVAYEKARRAHVEFCDGPTSPDSFATAAAERAYEAEADRLCDIRVAAREVIQHRPVRTFRDFTELAFVVSGELWIRFPDGTWDKHSFCDELEEALQSATWQLLEGGLHG